MVLLGYQTAGDNQGRGLQRSAEAGHYPTSLSPLLSPAQVGDAGARHIVLSCGPSILWQVLNQAQQIGLVTEQVPPLHTPDPAHSPAPAHTPPPAPAAGELDPDQPGRADSGPSSLPVRLHKLQCGEGGGRREAPGAAHSALYRQGGGSVWLSAHAVTSRKFSWVVLSTSQSSLEV